jgi:small subunit ribosomal protein S27Ae
MPDEKKSKTKKEFAPYKPGKMCPKCGARMGEHSDRYACGRCGYTEFKKKSGA